MKTSPIIEVTNDSIQTTVAGIFAAAQQFDTGRVSYFRLLLKAAQAHLGGKRNLEATAQLAALAAEHTRFYEIVLREAEKVVPANTKDRGVEVNRRSNFARSALSALRGHVRAGKDICALNPDKTTKGSLAVPENPARPPTAKRYQGAAERSSKALFSSLDGLAQADKETAVSVMRAIIAQLSERLLGLHDKPVDKLVEAVAGKREVRVRNVSVERVARQHEARV